MTADSQFPLHDELFSPERMFDKILSFAEAEQLTDTKKALYFAREKHAGTYRKTRPGGPKVPYITHPLTMACQAHAMGIRDDAVLAVCLLHDVCEDCGVAPAELPVSETVQHSVALLTKHRRDGESEADMDRRYYAALAEDPAASIVKGLDRCNNVSLMALSFSREKLTEYIKETEDFSLPLLRQAKERYPRYDDAVFLLEYQIRSILETVKALLNHCGTF